MATNGYEWLQMATNGYEWLRMSMNFEQFYLIGTPAKPRLGGQTPCFTRLFLFDG
jgi:hypothetical protein